MNFLFKFFFLDKVNREVAFVQAIISAGIVHTVTRNCSAGSLDNCKCTRSSILNGNDDEQSMRNDFRWGGCSDNVELGYRVAVAHLDDRETGQDLKAKIRLHNHRVGRIVSNLFPKKNHFFIFLFVKSVSKRNNDTKM